MLQMLKYFLMLKGSVNIHLTLTLKHTQTNIQTSSELGCLFRASAHRPI